MGGERWGSGAGVDMALVIERRKGLAEGVSSWTSLSFSLSLSRVCVCCDRSVDCGCGYKCTAVLLLWVCV